MPHSDHSAHIQAPPRPLSSFSFSSPAPEPKHTHDVANLERVAQRVAPAGVRGARRQAGGKLKEAFPPPPQRAGERHVDSSRSTGRGSCGSGSQRRAMQVVEVCEPVLGRLFLVGPPRGRERHTGAAALAAACDRVRVSITWIGERGFCLMKGIAEGTYNSKHAEAARLYYTTTTTTTTTHIHTHTPTEL